MSVPAQPFATYVAPRLPVLVVIVFEGVELPDGRICALPLATQGELKVTVTGPPVYSVLFWSTMVTVSPTVPPAAKVPLVVSPIAPAVKFVPVPLPIV